MCGEVWRGIASPCEWHQETANRIRAASAVNGFVHLHAHSYYSFFDSTLSPRQIVEFAQAQGMSHIALTDTNSFTGLIEFNLHCKEAGITLVLGVEVRQPLAVHRKMLAKRAWKYQEEDAEESSNFLMREMQEKKRNIRN